VKPKDHDTTIARIAGNVMAGLIDPFTTPEHDRLAVVRAVNVAIEIVAEVKRRDQPHDSLDR